jgi:hypothetical protein
LPAGEVTFSWNAAGDELTVSPDEMPLAEGELADPDAVDPLEVRYAIGTGATSAQGVALEEPLEISSGGRRFRQPQPLSVSRRVHAGDQQQQRE